MSDKRFKAIIGHMISGNDEKAQHILNEMIAHRLNTSSVTPMLNVMLESSLKIGENNV
jgi:hypothetical protein